jgi:hypothetical protein
VEDADNLAQVGTVDVSRRAAVSLSIVSVPLALLALVGAVAITAAMHPGLGSVSVIEIGLPLLVSLLVTPLLHEGVHGLAFLVLGGHPRFGIMTKAGFPFPFASCPGRRFEPFPFVAVGLAPLVLLDLVAFGLLTNLHTAGWGTGMLAINTAGSIGDLWLSAIVLRRPRSTRWEATKGQFVVWDVRR